MVAIIILVLMGIFVIYGMIRSIYDYCKISKELERRVKDDNTR